MSGAAPDLGEVFLEGAIARFEYIKGLGAGALAQLGEDEMRRSVGADVNPIAVIVKHLHGNMLSRWTDFLTADGEKAWRERNGEFIDDGASRDEVLRRWEEGWARLFEVARSLQPEDLAETVTIRGEAHSVPQAMMRQLDHAAYHVGQIVTIAKMLRGEAWRTLTVPRGGSEAHNQSMGYDPTDAV